MVLDGGFFLLFGGFARESNYGSLYLDYYYHSGLLFNNAMDHCEDEYYFSYESEGTAS